MVKRRIILLTVLLVLVAGAYGIFSRSRREPEYKGKPASYWLMRMRAPEALTPVEELKLETPGLKLETEFGLKTSGQSLSDQSPTDPTLPYRIPGPNSSAREAFLAMGDAAVPFLLRNLRSENSVLSENAATILSQSASINRDVLAELVEVLRTKESRQHQIYRTLSAVLPNVVRSKLPPMKVPQKFYNRYADPWYMRGMRAQGVIRAMRIRSSRQAMMPIFEMIPLLNNALNDREDKVVYLAAGTLGSLGPDAQRAVPTLVKQLMNTRRAGFAREEIVLALARIGIFDEKVTWALVSAAQSPAQERMLQCAAIATLGKGGVKCKDGVPELKKFLKSPDAVLRRLAYESLLKIEPVSVAEVKAPEPIIPTKVQQEAIARGYDFNGTDDYSIYKTYRIKD